MLFFFIKVILFRQRTLRAQSDTKNAKSAKRYKERKERKAIQRTLRAQRNKERKDLLTVGTSPDYSPIVFALWTIAGYHTFNNWIVLQKKTCKALPAIFPKRNFL
ncbi:MAG: hypothetical protein BGO54_15385 [Sphingobacteriales bacterium 46-32]|nr:MAG: hypothetical protein BGO54_15385 [Sphingobacteriales bacterium 46-32]